MDSIASASAQEMSRTGREDEYSAPMLLRHRVHEMLADRLSWVQYPDIRADLQRRRQRQPFFKYAMPLYQRFALLCFGLCLILIAAAMATVIGVCLWSLITA